MKKLAVVPHLSHEYLIERYKTCEDAHLKTRWQVILLRSEGAATSLIMNVCKVGATTLQTWIRQYNQNGPESVTDGRATNGRAPYLNAEQQEELRRALGSDPPDGGLWTGPKVAQWLRTRLEKPEIHEDCGWKYLNRLGFTPKRPRPRHPDADVEAQESFKKKSLK